MRCWQNCGMVAAVHFFAHSDDEDALLSYVGYPSPCSAFPCGPINVKTPRALSRSEMDAARRIGLLNTDLGDLVSIRPGDSAFDANEKSGLFNRINWSAFRPAPDEALVDWNRTPALFWERGMSGDELVSVSNIGSQADAMAAISRDYERWVKRCMGWVRRKGTPVWKRGPNGGETEFDVTLQFLNTVYALPSALALLREGGRGRELPD